MKDQQVFELSENDYEPTRKSLIGSFVSAVKNGFKTISSANRSRVQSDEADQLTAQYMPQNRQAAQQQLFTGLQTTQQTQVYQKQQMVVIPAQLFMAYKNYRQNMLQQQINQQQALDEQELQIKALTELNNQLLQQAEKMRLDYVRIAKNAEVSVVRLQTRKPAASEPAPPPQPAVVPRESENATVPIENKNVTSGSVQTDNAAATTSQAPQDFKFKFSANETKTEPPKFTFGTAAVQSTSQAAASAPAESKPFTFSFGVPSDVKNEKAPPPFVPPVQQAQNTQQGQPQPPKAEPVPQQKPIFSFGGGQNPSVNTFRFGNGDADKTSAPAFNFNFGGLSKQKNE